VLDWPANTRFALVDSVPLQRALGTFVLAGSGWLTFHATVLSAMFIATICGLSGVFGLGAPKLTPSESWPGMIVFSAFGIAPRPEPAPSIEQRYSKCVFGLYDDGCQSTPPSADGADARNVGPFLVYAYGVKMQPTMNGLPSGAGFGHSLRVEHCFLWFDDYVDSHMHTLTRIRFATSDSRERTLRWDGDMLGRETGDCDWESQRFAGANFAAEGRRSAAIHILGTLLPN